MLTHPSFNNRKHAIVIGGSIAGLSAARILLNYFERVTIVERDHYPQEPSPRPGIPQSNQLHILLKRGLDTIEELFPGIIAKMQAKGAVPFDFCKDTVFYYGEGRAPRFASSINIYSQSRALIDWLVHQEMLQYQQLQILEGHEIVGLLTDANKQIVTGVKLRERSHQSPSEQDHKELEADLVVDASGRSTSTPRWLQELGFMTPPETIIDPFQGYASAVYELNSDYQPDWKCITIVTSLRQGKRGGVILPLEDNRLAIGISGVGRDYPPTDEEGFLEFARSLPEPLLYTTLKNAKRVSTIRGYRHMENRWHHYERLRQLPENLVMIGDAVCAFNPVYGQGMTVAMLEAKVLDTYLKRYANKELHGLAFAFQKEIARTVAVPWQLSTSADSQLPTTEGAEVSTFGKLLNGYFDRLTATMLHNYELTELFCEVIQLVRPPASLMKLDIIRQTLLQTSKLPRDA